MIAPIGVRVRAKFGVRVRVRVGDQTSFWTIILGKQRAMKFRAAAGTLKIGLLGLNRVRVSIRVRVRIRIRVRVRPRVRVECFTVTVGHKWVLGLGLDIVLDTTSIRGSNSVVGVCDFESVPRDQLCPSANERLTGARDLMWIHAHTQGYHDSMLTLTFVRSASIGSSRERQNSQAGGITSYDFTLHFQ